MRRRTVGIWTVAYLLALPAASFAQAPFDLVWKTVDDGGFPLNPYWNWQLSNLGGKPDPARICRDRPPWGTPCTSQGPWSNRANCAGGGHANWMDVTYTGTLSWGSHSSPAADDDYSIYLKTENNAGLTVNNGTGLEAEFDSSETIDRFYTPWWNDFHSAVDQPTGRRNPAGFLQDKFAIVTGLMGLDNAHNSGQTELHPVYAIAIRTNATYFDPSWPIADEESWSFFVRNWGNEGYCSSGNETTPHTQFTFRLPWPKRTVSASVKSATVLNRGPQENGGPTWAWQSRPDLQATLLTVTIRNPGHGDLVHGELQFWLNPRQHLEGDEPKPISPADVARVRSLKSRQEEVQQAKGWQMLLERAEDEAMGTTDLRAEQRIGRLIRNMTDEQRAALARQVRKPEPLKDTRVTPMLQEPPKPVPLVQREAANVSYPEFDKRLKRNRAILREFFGSAIETP